MRPLVALLSLLVTTAAAVPYQHPGLTWGAQPATVAAQLAAQGYRPGPTPVGGPLYFKSPASTLQAGFTEAGGLEFVRVCYPQDRTAALTRQYRARYGQPGRVPQLDGPPMYDQTGAFWPARAGRDYHGPAVYVGHLAGSDGSCRTALEFHQAW